jgi:hypothetical protein
MNGFQELHDRMNREFVPEEMPAADPIRAAKRPHSELMLNALATIEVFKLVAEFAWQDRVLIWGKARSMLRF